MAESLAARTGSRFDSICNPQELTAERLASVNPRYIFFPHWSHRIDANVFKQFECIIFHMTDLPYGRGGSPLQNLIARGISETKISALRCVDEMDAGPIYLKRPLSLHGSAEEIFLRAAKIIEDMIVEIINKQPDPVPQQGEPTVFKRRKPEQSNMAGVKTLEEAFDLIRMLDADGYPHAFLEIGPFKLEFTRASRKTGQVVSDVRITLANSTEKGRE
jgi:methionyl-tRNA formyltransferase